MRVAIALLLVGMWATVVMAQVVLNREGVVVFSGGGSSSIGPFPTPSPTPSATPTPGLMVGAQLMIPIR